MYYFSNNVSLFVLKKEENLVLDLFECEYDNFFFKQQYFTNMCKYMRAKYLQTEKSSQSQF